MTRKNLHKLIILVAIFSLIVVSAVTPAFAGQSTIPLTENLSNVSYQPPPGTMPVIFISGNAYQMGYQYGEQAGSYIEFVKDSLWASLLANYSKSTILAALAKYEACVKDLPNFNFIELFKGMAAGAQAAGYDVNVNDILAINYEVELDMLPLPKPSAGQGNAGSNSPQCTNIAAWGGATVDGNVYVGSNFDYPWENRDPYNVLVVAFPSNGNSFIAPATAGRLGDNFEMNNKGLVLMSNKAPNARPQDIGYGVTDFILDPYVAITCSTAKEAENVMMKTPGTNGINHLVVDEDGNAYAIETTAALKAVRKPGDFGERDYLITTNHFLNPAMKEAQKPWNPLAYYPSSYYRYITAAKYIQDNFGQVDAKTLMSIMGSVNYWDGSRWHDNAEWTENTIDRFATWGGTLHSKVAIPRDKTLYLCAGNPNVPYWGTLAPGETGAYVKLQLKDAPASVASAAQNSALADLMSFGEAMTNDKGKLSINAVLMLKQESDSIKNDYWEGVHYLVNGSLSSESGGALGDSLELYGKATTEFCKVQALTKFLLSLIGG